jgi:outer membrane lipoprotein-sorting protein
MSMVIKNIELNPVVQDSEFDFPVAEKKEIEETNKKSATSKAN